MTHLHLLPLTYCSYYNYLILTRSKRLRTPHTYAEQRGGLAADWLRCVKLACWAQWNMLPAALSFEASRVTHTHCIQYCVWVTFTRLFKRWDMGWDAIKQCWKTFIYLLTDCLKVIGEFRPLVKDFVCSSGAKCLAWERTVHLYKSSQYDLFINSMCGCVLLREILCFVKYN